MADPHGIALDPKNKLVFVTNWGSLNERTKEPPAGARIEGRTARSAKRANGPRPASTIFPAPASSSRRPSPCIRMMPIRIFDRKANGNARPLRTITGKGAGGAVIIATYPKNGLIVAAVQSEGGGDGDLSGRFAPEDYIGVWSVYDNGEVPPRFMVGGPKNIYKDIRGVAVDAKNKNLIASDKTLNAIMTFHVPEAF